MTTVIIGTHGYLVDNHGYYVPAITAAYVQAIMKPYVEVIDSAQLEEIAAWIPLAIPGGFGEDVLDEFNTIILTNRNLGHVQHQLILFIIKIIIGDVIIYVENTGRSTYILPWDFEHVLGAKHDYARMFGIAIGQTQLPVDIVLNKRQFSHMLTEEFTVGLLIASMLKVGAPTFTIMMFGVIMDDIFLNLGRDDVSKYDLDLNVEVTPKYGVALDGRMYAFDTLEFMQGFITGCQWRGLSYKDYIRNLTQYHIDPKDKRVIHPQALTVN